MAGAPAAMVEELAQCRVLHNNNEHITMESQVLLYGRSGGVVGTLVETVPTFFCVW